MVSSHSLIIRKIMEVMVFSAREVLDIAIRLEKNGETVYRDAIKKLSDPNLSLLLEWMADEEARHARCFSRMQEKLTLEPPDPMAEEMGRDLLKNLLAGQSFSLEDVDFSRIDHINAMIATFIEFEKDTILFYQMLEAFIKDDLALQELNEIVAEEERHIEKLKSLMHREPLATAGGP
jgi:rubrerythrin